MHRILLATLLVATAITTASADDSGTAVAFNAQTRYSWQMINSQIDHFTGKDKDSIRFAKYDADGNVVNAQESRKSYFDYVAGLVAKGILSACEYYGNTATTRPWYYSVAAEGEHYASLMATDGKSFDNVNAAKTYPALKRLASAGGAFASLSNAATVLSNCSTAAAKINTFFTARNSSYLINSTEALDNAPYAKGGWWHKNTYENQMWLDGAYMGPALLAEMIPQYGPVAGAPYVSGSTDAEKNWKMITRQFDIVWNYLWDPTAQIMYHGFAAVPSTATSGNNQSGWADATTLHNSAAWARGMGWYFLALVDVIEVMPAGITMATSDVCSTGWKQDTKYTAQSDCRQRLLLYLNDLAAAIASKRDSVTKCWYNVLGPSDQLDSSNYLESSASAIFTAAFLKGQRLGYFTTSYEQFAKESYEAFVPQFVRQVSDGRIGIIHTSNSASLKGTASGTDGTASAYNASGNINEKADCSEGKSVGAFILAAVEYERKYLPKETVTEQETTPTITLQQQNGSTIQQDATTHRLSIAVQGLSADQLQQVEYKWYRVE